jgi:hypothetical protein
MIKNNSDIGVFSISTVIFKDSNKDETFFHHSFFRFNLKLLQALYIQWNFL